MTRDLSSLLRMLSEEVPSEHLSDPLAFIFAAVCKAFGIGGMLSLSAAHMPNHACHRQAQFRNLVNAAAGGFQRRQIAVFERLGLLSKP